MSKSAVNRKRIAAIISTLDHDPATKAIAMELLSLAVEETLVHEMKHGVVAQIKKDQASGFDEEVRQTAAALSSLIQLVMAAHNEH